MPDRRPAPTPLVRLLRFMCVGYGVLSLVTAVVRPEHQMLMKVLALVSGLFGGLALVFIDNGEDQWPWDRRQ